MCVKPLVIHRKERGMDAKHMFNAQAYTNTVPCGKCPECLRNKVNSWLFRMDIELERAKNPLFITLTYSTPNLTYGADDTPTLVKRDVQLFLKKLRKQHEKTFGKCTDKLKYYACGEYGSTRHRPHYHLIMYNLLDVNLVSNCWDNGHTYSLPLRSGGTAYVLKYMSKPKSNYKTKEREFSLMSKNIGDNYLTPAMVKYHTSSIENCYVRTRQGYKMSMPKYYKELIYTDPEKRKEVTEYLKDRTLESITQRINVLKKRYPHRDENFYLNLVEQSKLLLKFDKRLNEVL